MTGYNLTMIIVLLIQPISITNDLDSKQNKGNFVKIITVVWKRHWMHR
jgi:hypothetical protein